MSVQWRTGRIEEVRLGESVDSTEWGAFTTAGCDQGRPLLWSRHSQRLLSSLFRMGAGEAPVLPSEDELCELLCAADLDGPARVRVVAQRVGSNQWNIEASAMSCGAVGPMVPAKLAVHRWTSVPPLVGHKTLARQPWNLARERAQQKGAHDAMLVDSADHLLESSVANVWILRDRTVRTPRARPLSAGSGARVAARKPGTSWPRSRSQRSQTLRSCHRRRGLAEQCGHRRAPGLRG